MATNNESLNTVSAKGQLKPNQFVDYHLNDGDIKVLFIGNSITRHGIAPQIGWHGNWGMAASCEEKDFVHQTVKGLEERGLKVDFCIAQVSDWERRFDEDKKALDDHFTSVQDFAADVVIVRVGENMRKDILTEGKRYFDSMIRYFLTNPKAKVIVTDSFWEHPIRDPFIREICQERGYTFCQISDLEKDPKCMALGQFEHKGVSVHPSDYGMEQIAKRLLALI